MNEQHSLKEIAKKLSKDPTTISKEIKRNRHLSGKKRTVGPATCSARKYCQVKGICYDDCDSLCKKCQMTNCYKICPEYQVKQCPRLERFPHVCNGCEQIIPCKRAKFKYRAKVAYTQYEEDKSQSRQGIFLSKEELDTLDDLISPLVLKGQSLAHIYAHHKDEIRCSKRTLYTYFEQNLFTARNIDLPRKVKYKPRKIVQKQGVKKSQHRINRTYKDYLDYMKENPDTQVVEMDTVYGKKGEKCLLTLLFKKSSLMLIFLLDACSQEAVEGVFNTLYSSLGAENFRKLFPVILTDNGSEFKAPESIEFDSNHERKTRLYYCDPMASHQKGAIEKNHEFIRYILPKGKSFKHLTPDKVTLMTNHINSVARAKLNDLTPFKLAQLLLDKSLFDLCHLELIPSDEVFLKPSLLK